MLGDLKKILLGTMGHDLAAYLHIQLGHLPTSRQLRRLAFPERPYDGMRMEKWAYLSLALKPELETLRGLELRGDDTRHELNWVRL